jgi:transposase-like protein
MDASPVPPTRVTTGHPLGEAKCYPPALRTRLAKVEHRTSKYLNNGLERDHQHLKGRMRPMRRFKTMASASNFCRGHTLIRNLGRGFSALTAAVSPRQRLVTAWSTLTASL